MALRAPGLNEKRCLVRQGLGFYTALAATGIYRLHHESASLLVGNKGDERFVEILSGPLAECIQQHPILSTLIDDIETESPSFRRASEIDLENHIKSLRPSDIDPRFSEQDGTLESEGPDSLISRTLEVIHNQHFENTSIISPWKVYVLSIPETLQLGEPDRKPYPTGEQVLISFAYSHAIGDGASGLAFHRTLTNALDNQNSKTDTSTHLIIPSTTKCRASSQPLPPAIDSPTQLPISWSYFLSAILDAFIPKPILPRFLQQFPQDANTKIWTGGPVFFVNNDNSNNEAPAAATPATAKSAAHYLAISSDVLSATLYQCRANKAKLSSLLHQIIVNALHHELLNLGIETNTFLSSTSTDLRRAAAAYGRSTTPDHQMGVMASAVKQVHRPIPIPILDLSVSSSSSSSSLPSSPSPSTLSSSDQQQQQQQQQQSAKTDEFWITARQTTTLLAESAKTLQDQQIGLLKYVSSSLRSWHTEKLGKKRETSYELSNVMSLDVTSSEVTETQPRNSVKIVEKMIFSQPADVTGPAMSVNVVSIRGGELSIVLNWQIGALGFDLNLVKDKNKDKGNGVDHTERPTTSLVSDTERVERTFITRVAKQIKIGMQTIADMKAVAVNPQTVP